MIDRSLPVPLYHQLERILREQIAEGQYAPGDLLPSEAELRERYGVSRSVVRQTLNSLGNAGLVTTVRGRGTFVAEPKLHERFVQRRTGFYDDLSRMGLEIRTRVLRQEVVELPLEVQDFLRTERGVRIDRVRSVDGRALTYVTTYLPEGICPGIEHADLTDRSLYYHLQDAYGLRVHSGTRTVEAVEAPIEVAQELEVAAGTPMLLLRSRSAGEDAHPLEWFDAWHRADRTMFEFEILPGEGERPVHHVPVVRDNARDVSTPQDEIAWQDLVGDLPSGGRLVAVLRAPQYGNAVSLVQALVAGGVDVIEFTLTGANALEAINAAAAVDGSVIGAGSVLDVDMAKKAIEAGAQFLVAPVGAFEIAEVIRQVPVILGGYTPSEIWQAWKATQQPVKLFPADLGGPSYLRALNAPMPDVPLMPSGGVNEGNAGAYLEAGAVAVAAGSSLCPVAALVEGDAATLKERARQFVATLDRGLDE